MELLEVEQVDLGAGHRVAQGQQVVGEGLAPSYRAMDLAALGDEMLAR
ncbi:MAG: hypothetical protein NVSMB55_08810 [Mycobacteriales bacterium]